MKQVKEEVEIKEVDRKKIIKKNMKKVSFMKHNKSSVSMLEL